MSIYSGFATRQQQQTYDHCVNSLLYVLQKRITKFYTHEKTDEYKFATLVQKMFLQLKHMEKSKYLDPKCSTALTQLVDVLQKTNLSEHNATQQDNSNKNATIQQSQHSNDRQFIFSNKNQTDQAIFQRNYHPPQINKSGHLRQNKYHLLHNKVNHKPIFNVPILNNNKKNTANSNNNLSSLKKTNQVQSNRQHNKQEKDKEKKKLSSKKQNQENTSNQKVKMNILSNYQTAHITRQKKQSSFSNNLNHKTLDHIVSQNNTINVKINQPVKVFAISKSRTKIQNITKQEESNIAQIGLKSNIRSRIASSGGQRKHIYNKRINGQANIFNTYDRNNQFQRSAQKQKQKDLQRNLLRSSSNSQKNYRSSYSSFNKKKIQKAQKSKQSNLLKETNFSPDQYQLILKNENQISQIIKDYLMRVKKGGPQKYEKTKNWALISRFQDY